MPTYHAARPSPASFNHTHRSRHHKSHSARSYTYPRMDPYYEEVEEEQPWKHMAHAYTWVVEQEFVLYNAQDHSTEEWVIEQQVIHDGLNDRGREGTFRKKPTRTYTAPRQDREEIIYTVEKIGLEEARMMEVEEEIRWAKMQREKERRRRELAEQMRREAEALRRREEEAERRRIVEEQARLFQQLKEQNQRKQQNAERAIRDAWDRYEKRWSTLSSSSERLSFSQIPWPMIKTPKTSNDLRPEAVSSFLLSPLHSQSLSKKERLRNALLRWHPDRFQRILRRVKVEDKAQVEAAVGIVIRCLNEMK